MGNDRIAAVILSAGYSSRMGKFKPLLPIGEKAAVERIADSFKSAGIDTILVVTGYNREALQPILKANNLIEAFNKDYNKGMFESIKAGIRAALTEKLADGISAILLTPVDYPLIPKKIIGMLLGEHSKKPSDFIVPCYKGKKGHPLLIPINYVDEIMDYDGNRGLKGITSKYEGNMIRLETHCEAVVMDMDTIESYNEILEYYESQKKGVDKNINSLEREIIDRRIFLIRHGEIRRHKEKIFLGQYDPPLSEKGRKQAENAGKELLEHELFTKKIYASDLVRAKETAEIISKTLSDDLKVITESGFSEMALGKWDGRFISEIKEQYPEKYKERGENLLRFKIDNDSENFYDLRYRAFKSLKKILKEDVSKDIVIVTHSGVIKVLMSALYDTPLSLEVKKSISNGEIMILDGGIG